MNIYCKRFSRRSCLTSLVTPAGVLVVLLMSALPGFSEEDILGLPPLTTNPAPATATGPATPAVTPEPEMKAVPESPASIVFHGESLVSQGKLNEAHEVFDRFLHEHPTDEHVPEVLVQQARLEYLATNYYGALQFLDFLLESYPGTKLTPTAKLIMAECYLKLGQVKESETLLKIP